MYMGISISRERKYLFLKLGQSARAVYALPVQENYQIIDTSYNFYPKAVIGTAEKPHIVCHFRLKYCC